ncbi:hypothetical protein Acr_23g0000980 [Actinidia rufa]|uniref:Uncharacterized protein n=1 Tax=Actinidia rufa TaxID=165716 RepID=A0A7J0GLN1_9ERIC|nr:hypothetical protein Acr_23g0000980 [Actinidia rufa]
MDLPALILMLVGLGVFSSFLAPFVESQGDVIPGQESLSPPSPPPPPPSPPSPSRPPRRLPSPPPPPPYTPPALRPSQSPRSSGPSPAPEPTLSPASWPAKQELNLGKKIGLMFAGIVVILQVCVVAFLVIKRRQLLKNHGRY